MRRCPACGNSYSDEAKFCAMDATQLQPLEAAHHTLPAFPAVSAALGREALSGRLPGVIEPRPRTGEWSTEVQRGVIIAGHYQLDPEFADLPTGQLHRAVDLSGGAQVLVKLVPPSAFASAMWVDRTLRELRQLSRVTSPRVMRVLAQGRTPASDLYVVFTPPPDGAELLDEHLLRQGVLSPDRARGIVMQIGEALMEAQQAGVVHRNIAPHTIYLSTVRDRDEVLVVDFGLTECIEVAGRIIQGPPHYLAPEQAEGKAVDQRANIYSLGAIYHYLLTGSPPFSGKNTAEVLLQVSSLQQAPPASKLRPSLPMEVDRLISKALDKSSSRRQLTLRQFLNEVEELHSVAPGPIQKTAPLDVRPYRSATKTMIMGGSTELAAVTVAPKNGAAGREPILLSKVVDRAERRSEPPVNGGGGPARTLIGLPVVSSGRPDRGNKVTPAALAAAFSGGSSILPRAYDWDDPTVAGQMPPQEMENGSLGEDAEEDITLAAAPAAQSGVQQEGPAEEPEPPTLVEESYATIPMPRLSEAELMATFGLEVPLRPATSDYGQIPAEQVPEQMAEQAPAQMAGEGSEVQAPAEDGRAAVAVAAHETSSEAAVRPARSAAARTGGKRESAEMKEPSSANKVLRETAWFKRGEIEGGLEHDAPKSEEVHISPEDQSRLSLQTGRTGQYNAVGPQKVVVPGRQMSEKEIIDEMRGRNRLTILVIVLLVMAGVGVLVWTLIR